MKTCLILCFSLLTVHLSFGQVYVDGVAIDTVNTPFCQIICTNAASWTRTQVQIDYGQRFVDTRINRQKIGNATQPDIRFNSSIDALNFMVRHGWEVASFATRGDSFIYLLQRKKT